MTEADRDHLIDVAEEFNEYEREEFQAPKPTNSTIGERPGDDFNARGDWNDILKPHGWKCLGSRGMKTYWQRPGKDGDGCSATTGYCRTARSGEGFWVFSTSTEFEPEKFYSKFAVLTFLNHGKDFSESGKALYAAGWGKHEDYPNLTSGGQPLSRVATPQPSASSGIPETERIIQWASEVTPRRMEWLWPGRIPLGKLVAFAGPGGIGKTMVLMDLVARITTGAEWPFGKGECAKQAKVIYISGEDEPDDTLVPRLIQCGADLTKVCFLKSAVLDSFTMADFKTMERAVKEAGEGEVMLVVFDPPTSFVGDVDDHKNAELKRLFKPLISWGARHKITVLFNTHINKTTSNPDAAGRVIGSVAWVNTPRAAYMFTKDVNDSRRRLVSLFKQNLGEEQPSMVYQIVTEETILGKQARVEWIEEIDITADEAMAKKPDKQTQRCTKAAEWLIERFREKRKWTSEDLFKMAKHQGVSRNAIFEAKEALHLPNAQKVTVNGSTDWVWWVPDNWEPLGNNRDTSEDEEFRTPFD